MQRWRMRVVIAAVVLALDVGAASAGAITGTIQTVDTQEKVYTLADGTKLWPQPGHHVVVLRDGRRSSCRSRILTDR